MKIVYIHESIAHKGGLERIFVDKMNYLADRLQYEVYLLTASQGNTPVSFPLSPGSGISIWESDFIRNTNTDIPNVCGKQKNWIICSKNAPK